MKPALSVVFFTVSSGAGLGLLALLALARLAHAATPTPAWWQAGLVAMALITAGLLSSTLHLANPRNAWRAFARMRTSWLSREGVLAVLLYPVAGAYALALWQGPRALQVVLGVAVIGLSLGVLYCTAMIYACLKTIPRWNTWHTRLAYPLFGLMSGALLLSALVPVAAAPVAARIGVALLALGAALKLAYYLKFADGKASGPSAESALNLSVGRVRVLDVGHAHGPVLTDEFGFRLARERATLLKLAVFVLAFVLPFVLMGLSPALAPAASVLCLAGLLVERWLFFAEARHVVRLYHGQSMH
jgi:DMSO reductase anchor subunit